MTCGTTQYAVQELAAVSIFRHATMMLENNIELDYVSKRLGYSTIATMANITI